MKMLAILVSLSLIGIGCCVKEKNIDPFLPSITSEWKEREQGGIHILGTFVLRLNEVTSNGKLDVKITGLIAGDSCAEYGSYARQKKATLQFIDHKTQKILCEESFIDGGSSTLFSGQCQSLPNDYGVAAVYVKSISIKDGWVYFELGS